MGKLKIILNGRACSGKDTVAEILNLNHGFSCFSFSEGIYDIAYKNFKMTKKDRELLQAIGQKMREIRQSVWVDTTYGDSEEWFADFDDSVVITDCRQANELIRGIELEYIPIRISASLETRVRRALIRDNGIREDDPSIDIMVKRVIAGDTEPHQSYHIDISKWENESETGADGFNYIEIENNGTLEELKDKIDHVIRGLILGEIVPPHNEV